jgi:hypothetical protein
MNLISGLIGRVRSIGYGVLVWFGLGKAGEYDPPYDDYIGNLSNEELDRIADEVGFERDRDR